MADWDNWRLFVAVAKAGGLASAAKSTGKSPPTLSRRMRLLEQQTGTELFHRLPRGYELTESGKEVFIRIEKIEAELQSLGSIDQKNQRSLVKVSAGSWMTFALCQNIKMIVDKESANHVRFISDEATLDISRRETTIGIRNARPSQENLVCRNLGKVHFAGYALTKSVSNWVLVNQDTPSTAWLKAKLKDKRSSKKIQYNLSATIEVTSPRNALDIAEAGAGRVVLPTFVGDSIRKLKRVTPKISELSHEQWLVTHPDEQYHQPVRQVIDGIYRVAKDLHR